MAQRRSASSTLRVVMASAMSALLAPLVFVGVIALRKIERRILVHSRHWSKRIQNEIARWS